jgi:hypothetical protein
MSVTRRDPKPGERFLGGSGVILFKGLKKKPRKPDPPKKPKVGGS